MSQKVVKIQAFKMSSGYNWNVQYKEGQYFPHWIHSKQDSKQDTQKTTITQKTAFLSQPVLILLHTYPLPHYYNGPLFLFALSGKLVIL